METYARKPDFPTETEIVVTCASGVESALKKEIFRLFQKEVPAINGAITFKGSVSDVVKANLNLRTAERVYIKTSDFEAKSFDELFDGVKAVRWEDFIAADGKVTVNGKCVKSALFSISDCQRIIKKAVADRLCEKFGYNRLPESGAEYHLEFSVFKDRVAVMIDTSGVALHKRGYRDKTGVTPIKETLASAILFYSDFYRIRPFYDPFCGSGTFVIEGARIALNIAPGIDRRFAFNDWKNFDEKLYFSLRQEAADGVRDIKIDFCGSDIDAKAVKLAEYHAKRAGVSGAVKFSVKAVKDFKPRQDFGTVVTNPPYGVKASDIRSAEESYKDFGCVMKDFPAWSVFAIVKDGKRFEKFFGRKSDRERKLYNSELECRLKYYYGKNSEKGN